MRIALAQLNPTVGDFRANVDAMVRAARKASERGAQVVAFPELSLPGYPPRDLVERGSFLDRNAAELERLEQATADLDRVSFAVTPAALRVLSASGRSIAQP